MTILTGITPTPQQLKTAVKEAFGDMVRDAAGADGRLSRSEARKIADREDAGWILADNAENFFEATGQQSVSANKLVRLLGDYAERKAEQVAGPNQRLSLVEARNLPEDLQAEFFYLRGKGLPDRVEPADFKQAVYELAEAAMDNESMTRLSGPPWQVLGVRPLIENIPHPQTETRGIVYVAQGQVYLSRAASLNGGTHLVGWYHVGAVPQLDP